MADEKLPEGVKFNKPSVKRSLRLWKKIAALYAEGHSLTAISQMDGMPGISTLHLWKQKHIDFAQRLQAAKELRAERFSEKAIEAAENAIDKDDAPAARLKFDAYCKAAEWNDPNKYGKKVTHAGDQSNPIRFLVSTGFPEPNEHQRPPELNSDGTIKKISGASAPSFHEEEGPA